MPAFEVDIWLVGGKFYPYRIEPHVLKPKRRVIDMSANLVKVNSNWERYYATLKRMPKRLRKTAQFIVGALPDMKNQKVGKVLDLGCGAGRHCVLLGKSGFEVLGIDISRDALKMARRWARKEKLTGVAFARATMTNLPLNDSCLDAVISVSVIHHAFKRDIVTIINEIYRVLREDGLFLANLASVTDPRFGTGKIVEDNTFWITEAFEEKLFGELHHFFTRPEVLRMLHHFRRKRVSTMRDKPNYWKVVALK
jgi:ubiquinone/menaquinone biosynthesis C-methylase UbiE